MDVALQAYQSKGYAIEVTCCFVLNYSFNTAGFTPYV